MPVIPSASPLLLTEAPTASTTRTYNPSATLAPIPTSTAISQISSQDKAGFVSENYLDNSVLKPGEKFVKNWEIKNTGLLTWTPAYQLVLFAAPQGETFSSPAQISFSQETPPGGTLSLSQSLVAPDKEGTYVVYWSIKNEHGETVAVDGGNLWTKIRVCTSDQSCSSTSVGIGTSTNGIMVSLIQFTNDEESATVDFCMTVDFHTYILSPGPTLLVNQEPVPFLSGSSMFSNGAGCMEVKYQVSSSEIERAQQISLFIDGTLRMSPPPGDPDVACQAALQNLKVEYPGLDFKCHFSMAGYITDLSLPSGMSVAQANALITDTIEGAITGPWTLTIK